MSELRCYILGDKKVNYPTDEATWIQFIQMYIKKVLKYIYEQVIIKVLDIQRIPMLRDVMGWENERYKNYHTLHHEIMKQKRERIH